MGSKNKKEEIKSTNPFDNYYDPTDDTNDGTNDNIKLINTKKKKKDKKFGKSVGSLFNKNKKKKKNNNVKLGYSKYSTNKALTKAKQRGQKLCTIQDKSDQMVDTAKDYNGLAKQLANKSFFGF